MILVFGLEEFLKWDEVVKSFNDYDVYYLSSYVKAFKLNGDGEPKLFYYTSEKFRAINVFMLRDISDEHYFKGKIESDNFYDIVTPYGYGGFIFDGDPSDEDLIKLNNEYTKYCQSMNIVSEFARFNPLKNNSINNKKIYDVIKMGKTVTIELESLEQIWNDLSSKNRNVIRKSKKSGVKIYWGRSPILFDDFIPMYEKTMESDNASKYYFFNKEFFKNILDDLKFNSLIFYAIFNDKIISMAIIIFANGNMHYHLSASDKAYRSLAANNLLLYEVSCWGCENGFKKFHLGGGLGSQEDNLFKFKSAFNKDSNTYFSVGKRIFDIEKYDMLIRKRNLDLQVLEKSGFFPAYRI